MFDMFGDVGIFGDTLMPVMNVKENKETKAKKKRPLKKKKQKLIKGLLLFFLIQWVRFKLKERKNIQKNN